VGSGYRRPPGLVLFFCGFCFPFRIRSPTPELSPSVFFSFLLTFFVSAPLLSRLFSCPVGHCCRASSFPPACHFTFFLSLEPLLCRLVRKSAFPCSVSPFFCTCPFLLVGRSRDPGSPRLLIREYLALFWALCFFSVSEGSWVGDQPPADGVFPPAS